MAAELNLVTEVELVEARVRDVQGNLHKAVTLRAEAVDRPICWLVEQRAILDLFHDAMERGQRITLTLSIHPEEDK